MKKLTPNWVYTISRTAEPFWEFPYRWRITNESGMSIKSGWTMTHRGANREIDKFVRSYEEFSDEHEIESGRIE